MEYRIGYDNVQNFTFDSNLIEIAVGSTALKDLGGGSYSQGDPLISLISSFSATELLGLTTVMVENPNTEIKFVIEIDGVKKYWSGTDWINSAGTYSQSNSLSTINSNINTILDGTVARRVNIYTLLHSADGSDTPTISQLGINFDLVSTSITAIDLTQIEGYAIDASNAPLENTTITVNLIQDSVEYNGKLISPKIRTIKTNSSGYWTILLADTESMTPNDAKYLFTFKGQGFDDLELSRSIPKSSTAINFNDLNS